MTEPATAAGSVLALIDEAVEDWTVSHDAMRWSPAWDEPIVRSPRTPIEHLTHAGWDGYAAQAYPALAVRRALRGISAAVEHFGREVMKLLPRAVGATEVMQRLAAAHEAIDRKAKPVPFWAVQPQRERRRR